MFPEQRPVAAGTLRGDERVRRIDLRWGLYAYLLQDRTELVPEPACDILRLPHIDNAEAALSLSGDVNQKSFDGPVRRGVDALAVSELSHRFLVALPRQTCSLMNEYDRHGYLLGWSKRRKTTTALRREATLLRRHRTGNLPAWSARPARRASAARASSPQTDDRLGPVAKPQRSDFSARRAMPIYPRWSRSSL